jgi:hypothetical protein
MMPKYSLFIKNAFLSGDVQQLNNIVHTEFLHYALAM